MNRIIVATTPNWAATGLRVTLGSVLFAHGAQSLLGWFGGFGFTSTMQYLTGVEGLPWLIGLLVISLQFFGSLLLLIGLGTRLMAFATFFLFVGMILTSHLDYGFFMNWSSTQKGEGFEYHLLVLGMCTALAVLGGGAFSVDRQLEKSILRNPHS
ncbi:MAG: DoxX family protein [Cytophagales bacterium]|nr:DoxX family protein [Cytophagales bacterium]